MPAVQLLLLVVATVVGSAAARTMFNVNFDSSPKGDYSQAQALTDFGVTSSKDFWGTGFERGEIVGSSSSTNRWLRVTYPKGKVRAADSGLQMRVIYGGTESTMWVSYKVRFGGWNGPFDFVRGGKIPGLCGGTCPTGGKDPDGGFSARMMWRNGGDAIQYMYYENMAGHIYSSSHGENWYWDQSGANRSFPVNQWVTVETMITLNDAGKTNGVVKSYWNGELALSRTGLTLRAAGETFSIDKFYFATFFGGGDSSWAPPQTVVCDFDDIVVSTTRPAAPGPSTPTTTTTSAAPSPPAPTAPVPPPAPPAPSPPAAASIINVNFDSSPKGDYSKSQALTDFGVSSSNFWGTGWDRSEILGTTTSGNRWLRVTYPKGGVGTSSSGLQMRFTYGGTRKSVWVSYKVRFGGWNGAFEFVKGGKIPGLCGGTCPTGGKNPDGGFSARMMWRSGGDAVQYMYYEGQDGTYGEDWYWNQGGTQRSFPVNQWVTVETLVTLNDAGKANGVVKSYWNGELALSRTGLTLRAQGESFGIDTFYFSTFFGGSGSSWAPSQTVVADYDDIVVSTTRPSSSSPPTPPGPTPPAPTPPAPTPPAPTPPAPAPPSPPSGGGCALTVVVEKAKDYYTRITPTPLSAISTVTLTKATSSGASKRMSYSWRDYEAQTDKMTASREVRILKTNGDTEVFAVPLSPRPQADARLRCVGVSASASGAQQEPPAPTAAESTPVMLEAVAGRTKLAGNHFAPLVAAQAPALKVAVAADLERVLAIDTATHKVNVTGLQVGSLVVDFEVVAQPGVNASAALLNQRALQWALDEVAAEDSGRHNDTSADTSAEATPFSSTLSLYAGQAGVNDTIFMAAGVAAASPAQVATEWATHTDGAPVPAPAAPNAGADAGVACGAGCAAGVAIAGVVVGAALVAVAAVVLRRRQGQQPAATVAHQDFEAGGDMSCPMVEAPETRQRLE